MTLVLGPLYRVTASAWPYPLQMAPSIDVQRNINQNKPKIFFPQFRKIPASLANKLHQDHLKIEHHLSQKGLYSKVCLFFIVLGSIDA